MSKPTLVRIEWLEVERVTTKEVVALVAGNLRFPPGIWLGHPRASDWNGEAEEDSRSREWYALPARGTELRAAVVRLARRLRDGRATWGDTERVERALLRAEKDNEPLAPPEEERSACDGCYEADQVLPGHFACIVSLISKKIDRPPSISS